MVLTKIRRKHDQHKHGFEKNRKRTSKSSAKAIITCLIEENDPENADEYFESSDEISNEYSDVRLKFVDENRYNHSHKKRKDSLETQAVFS